MTTLALPVPMPGVRRQVSDLLYTRRGLLLMLLLVPPLLWFGVIYLGSLFALLANAFFGLDDFTGQVVREFTLKNFVELTEPANLDVARRSVTMAIVVTLVSIVLAFPVAYYMARYARGAQKALLYIAVMLPLWSSYLVRLYAWKLLLAKEGAISWAAQQLHLTWLLDALLATPAIGGPSLSFSTFGTFVVFVYMWLPFMILPIQAAIERIPASMVEASSDLGATPRTTFIEGDRAARHAGHRGRLDLHVLADARRLHHSAGDRRLDAVHRPGRLPAAGRRRQHPVRRRVFAGADRRRRRLPVDREEAGGLRCALIVAGRRAASRPAAAPSGAGAVRAVGAHMKASVALRVAAWAVIAFLHVPLALIIVYAFSAEDKSYVFPPPALTTQWFDVAWQRSDVWAAMKLSFQVAAYSTAAALVLGTLAAAALARTSFFGRDAISLLLILPIALPGVVTGIALRSAYHTLEIPFSFWTIVIGHATFCVVVVFNNACARLRRLNPNLIEASMDLGADAFQTVRYVVLPQLGSALLAGALLAFALSFDEVIVTTFTAGQQTTLPIWMLQELIRPRQRPVTNVVAVFVIALTFIPIVAAYALTRADEPTR